MCSTVLASDHPEISNLEVPACGPFLRRAPHGFPALRTAARTRLPILIVLLAIIVGACNRPPQLPALSSADSLRIVQDNIDHRTGTDRFFHSDPASPFVRDTSLEFRGLNWFPIDVRYRTTSALHRYTIPDTVTVLGTKGEHRRQLRYGYFEIVLPNDNGTPTTVRLNVYKFTPSDSNRYALYRNNLSVWFTDRTTGKETYHVGRYLEIGDEVPDPSHEYILDFNKAYNPYCAYSVLYSCAVPRDEDHIDISVRVGERPYHHD